MARKVGAPVGLPRRFFSARRRDGARNAWTGSLSVCDLKERRYLMWRHILKKEGPKNGPENGVVLLGFIGQNPFSMPFFGPSFFKTCRHFSIRLCLIPKIHKAYAAWLWHDFWQSRAVSILDIADFETVCHFGAWERVHVSCHHAHTLMTPRCF